jgi:hypothetical protein
MPQHDPITTTTPDPASHWLRYKRMMPWMVAASVIAALLALVYLWVSDVEMSTHLIIATLAGVSLSVLLGTGLMGLVFLSNAAGVDAAAAGREKEKDGRN